jgi:hypothetical protein
MAPFLTRAFVAGCPCLAFDVLGASSINPLICEIDTYGDYEIALLPQTASQMSYIPGFFLFNLRMIDGSVRTTRRGKVHLRLPWRPPTDPPQEVRLRIFNHHFNVLGHPPNIHGFVGRQLLKDVTLQIDHPNERVAIL